MLPKQRIHLHTTTASAIKGDIARMALSKGRISPGGRLLLGTRMNFAEMCAELHCDSWYTQLSPSLLLFILTYFQHPVSRGGACSHER